MAHRICVVAPEFIGPFPNGGVGTACYWEATTLGAAGHDVSVLYTGSVERETPEHWERHFERTAPFRYTDLGRWAELNESLVGGERDHVCPESRIADRVLAFLQSRPFDLVLFQEFLGHGSRALQAQDAAYALTGARTATTLHSCRQWIYEGMQRLPAQLADLAVDFLEKESAVRADRVLAPSADMARWARMHWKLARPIAVVPYCYDEHLARPREVIKHVGPFRHLVFFGRLETRKGLHLFCRALSGEGASVGHVERVTFLGKQSSVDGLPSNEYIRRAVAPDLQWEIKGDLGSLEALAWLSEQKNVLVVAPSLVDNLPYSLIELYCRRIPFISTRIGGIPEIVGEANGHLLATANEGGVRELIARVCRDGHLTVDYRSGYDVTAANAAHLDVVREMLTAPLRTVVPRTQQLSIVVIGRAQTDPIERVRTSFIAQDPRASDARWLDLDTWRLERRNATAATRRTPEGPVLFLDEGVRPDAGLIDRYLAALNAAGVDAVTSYYRTIGPHDERAIIAPLGASLESGWSQDCFGGPCLAVSADALTVVDQAIGEGAFSYWTVCAALACHGLHQAIVPAPLFDIAHDARRAPSHEETEAVVRQYHATGAARLDLGWLLKAATAGVGARARQPGDTIGQQLYKQLAAGPDDVSASALEGRIDDRALHDILTLRDRLSALVQRWKDSAPRVFVYGAGQHAKLMLQICPELGPLVAGFIDRRPLNTFLDRPCIRPDAFSDSLADAIVYSSREFEHEMYARMSHARVEHVLLYRESPGEPAVTSSLRLQNRFGHAAPDLSALHAMYHPPSWATGYISGGDAEFLFEMIAAHQPRTVVELGVASGASAAAILCGLDALPEITGGRVLYSCDVRSTCYFNESFATGQACTEMYPEPRARWRTEFDVDARRLARALPRGSVDLTFIDANHAHPWPLLDLLHVTAVAKPKSWVVLHDIDLPIHYPQYQVYGPRWLFEAWPFNKVKGIGRWVSIGAVQLPDDPSVLVPMAERLLARPWEHAPTMWHINLPPALATIQALLRRRLAPVETAVAS